MTMKSEYQQVVNSCELHLHDDPTSLVPVPLEVAIYLACCLSFFLEYICL